MGSFDKTILALKAAAEPTRLRILALLSACELNVKDLTQVLAQSQPRISRHLKLLVEAGLVERFREGSWVFLRLADGVATGRLAGSLIGFVGSDDPVLRRDRERAQALLNERATAAQAYFANHAAEWDRIRSHHVDEKIVESAIVEALAGPGRRYRMLADLGTGTGRILELMAERIDRGVGIDANQTMLAHARAKLETSRFGHLQIRQGDIYNLSFADRTVDAVVMHQVLHFLSEPAQALREAGRVLAAAGRLLIVDFSPHDDERLRELFAHQRLGFSTEQLVPWLAEAGLAIEHEQHLAPVGEHADGGGLSVSLWLCRRADDGRATAGADATLARRELETAT